MEPTLDQFLAALPEPTEADVARLRQRARRYTVVLLRQGAASRADEARNERLHQAHLRHLTQLQVAGKLVLNGPVLTEAGDLAGMSLYAAEPDEARALAEADPKVRAGYLTVEAIPWLGVASEKFDPSH
jgi:uncharacterized protein YciI